MENWISIIAIIAGMSAVIGAIWAFILMWRNSKTLFLVNLFIPLLPAIYFYIKYWRKDNVSTALYLQMPLLLFILLSLFIA